MDTSQYITLFIEESREHLAGLTEALSGATAQTAFPAAVLKKIFRDRKSGV